MTQDSDALVVPGRGYFYIAPDGTARPADDTEPASPWVEIGHTSYDDPFAINRDGGESTVLPTWQASAARTSTSSLTQTVGFTLHQHDEQSLQLYFGGGALDATSGYFEVPKTPTAQRHALFVRVVDGGTTWPHYFGSVDILGSDGIEYDPEALVPLPVTATILDDAGLDYLFAIKIAAAAP